MQNAFHLGVPGYVFPFMSILCLIAALRSEASLNRETHISVCILSVLTVYL